MHEGQVLYLLHFGDEAVYQLQVDRIERVEVQPFALQGEVLLNKRFVVYVRQPARRPVFGYGYFQLVEIGAGRSPDLEGLAGADQKNGRIQLIIEKQLFAADGDAEMSGRLHLVDVQEEMGVARVVVHLGETPVDGIVSQHHFKAVVEFDDLHMSCPDIRLQRQLFSIGAGGYGCRQFRPWLTMVRYTFF